MCQTHPCPDDVLACYPALCRAAWRLYRRCGWVRAWYGQPADVIQSAVYYALYHGLRHPRGPGVGLEYHLVSEGIRHACQEARERWRRVPFHLPDDTPGPPALDGSPTRLLEPPARDDPSAAVLARLDVAAAVGVLTAAERAALERRYGLAGHPPATEAEVAEALGLSPGGVARTLHDARARLKRHFRVGEGRGP